MKRITCLLLALLLCLAATAQAESTPSRTTSDMTTVVATAENLPAGASFSIQAIVENDAAYQQHIDACAAEMSKLADSQDVETYFAAATDSNGNSVSLKEILGTDTLNVYEFSPLVISGYEESYGKVTANMQFSTPFEAGEKVVVMIGLVTVDANGNQTVQWIAYEGVGLGDQGGIQVEFDPEIGKAIQEGIALVAVVSK